MVGYFDCGCVTRLGEGRGVFLFLNRLTLVDVFIGLGFWVRGSMVRCSAASRQYLNLSAKWR